jgi:hypothetical protein
MSKDTRNEFINQLSQYLPDRRKGKRGPDPIKKEVILEELFKLFRTNCGWRNIKHSSTCHAYLKEIQRRGHYKKFLNCLTKEITKTRSLINIIDSSDIECYRTHNNVEYSGKYHNNCIKLTIAVTENLIPVYGRLDKGRDPDSLIIDKMFLDQYNKPYELFLDKGYEKYDRRRNCKRENCQIRLEMKKVVTNRKRGRKFIFTDEHKKIRGSIEKVMSWIKSFNIMRMTRLRIKSLITAMFFFCLSYIAFMRLKKL